MGKDDKEDSGFGFKDKAKAVETLRLLEQHDMNYRRLTVRGLLGRAKRVLSMTKAEEKIKNIKEAMEVFEQWLADLDQNKKTDNKTEKKEDKKKVEKKEKKKSESDDSSSSSDVEMEEKQEKKKELPPDTVPGLGFKDAAAAEGTLKELQGRDPDYQKLAVKGLIGRAKRVLTCTRDETKISNIKEAMSIFEKFLDDFDSMHLSKQNNPYISLGIVRTAEKLAGDDVTKQQKSFIAAYASVRGEYKRLRTACERDGDSTWDIVRNSALNELKEKKSFISAYASVRGEYKRLRTACEQDGDSTWDIVRNSALKELKEKHADAKLFNEKDEPTKEHLQMLLWAYSPEAARVKKYVPETKEEREKESNDKKRRRDSKEDTESSDRKRRSSAKDDESPSKKSKEE